SAPPGGEAPRPGRPAGDGAAQGQGAAAAVLPDREKPFVLTSAGGERREYKHAVEALAVLAAGETLEVHGNGPFPLVPVVFEGKGLILKAAPGYRPRFVPAPGAKLDRVTFSWFWLKGAALRVEGCDFVGFPSNVFA